MPSDRIGEESWSHERLGDRHLFTRLSCFPSPFDPRAVARFGVVLARQKLSSEVKSMRSRFLLCLLVALLVEKSGF